MSKQNGFFSFPRVVCIAVVFCVVLGAAASGAAAAVAPSGGWMLESQAMPTSFSAADNEKCLSANNLEAIETHCDAYTVTLRNSGSVSSERGMTLSDVLPGGLTVRRVSLYFPGLAPLFGFQPSEDLFPLMEEIGLCSPSGTLSCLLPYPVAPDEVVRLIVHVTVNQPAARSLKNVAEVSGAGMPSASTESSNQISPTPAQFGFSNFTFLMAGLDGAPDRQAADHPYGVTTTFGVNNDLRVEPEAKFGPTSVQDVRDVVTDLPVGFVGSVLAAPQCSFSQLSSHFIEGGEGGCPRESIIGHIHVQAPGSHLSSVNGPIYNMQPEHGVPAEFAYVDLTAEPHVFYAHVVPTSNGYVLRVVNPEIPQIAITNVTVIFYGDPAQRDETGNPPIPFFTNPSDCTGEEPTATIYMDSWQKPARFNPDGTPVDLQEAAWAKAQSKSPPVTGCPALQFPAEIKAQPTTHEADKPSGMNFEIKLPQSETMGVPATPTLKKAVVTLPEGFTVDPSAGDGLQACSEAQIGWLGGARLNFSPTAPECPEASKIGSITLESPLVAHQLEGEMYLARQDENPFGSPEHPGGSLLAAYVVVDDPILGVLIKIPGKFEPDPRTGRLTAVFDENPNLPFSDLQLHFFGGPRAELATPESCGTFTVNTEMFPYSFEGSEQPATPFDNFIINEACPGGFSPNITAGSLNLQAGSYTPFVASFGRSDTDQELAGLSITLPPGLLANLTGIPLCTSTQIQQTEAGTGGCPEASQIGTVQTGVGPGPNPLFVGGKAYLTGPYNGGPYGLAVIVPAVAGPFNFGTVVVRQSLRIDPTTAQVTDVSDPFPTIIDGIPLRLRRVDVRLDRPGFTFNPTNCSKLGFTGSIAGTPLGAPRNLNGTVGYATEAGASSSFTTPFQVTNCTTLAFKPKLTVSTSGKTTRAKGASLSVKLTYPKAAFGSQANIKSVKVDLPKQLPSRLTTLQKACTAAQFQSNPAGCPAASMVGHATAITPVIPVPLTGPAYFVSYGGAKFPELVIVLQGNGITLDLHGETFINKAGITSSTFHTVPDAPVGSFELTLPQGRFSALAANGNLCKTKLKMPTAFTAQNGMAIKQSTPITTTGCAKEKAHQAKPRHRKK
jgi:hypothetical protein